MKQVDLLNSIKTKEGFGAIVSDLIAPDNNPTDTKEKHHVVVENINLDGTRGRYNVFYLLEKETGDCWFYNLEPASFQKEAKTLEQRVFDNVHAYCKGAFKHYFVTKFDFENKCADVEAFLVVPGGVTMKRVIVFKDGVNPYTHNEVI